ncbi:MAG: hypothetical protein RR473_11435 [Comamonas sp.]
MKTKAAADSEVCCGTTHLRSGTAPSDASNAQWLVFQANSAPKQTSFDRQTYDGKAQGAMKKGSPSFLF